jgi:predicted metal-dependent hydrolase
MTIKEIMSITGLSRDTILNKVKEKFPNKISKGKTTRLNQEESITVVKELKIEVSKNLTVIQPTNISQVPTNISYVTKEELKDFAKEIIKELLPLIQNNQKQIEIKQDYYSILGFCNLNKIQITFSEAIKYGKEAKRLSEDEKYEVRKIPDERYGNVNSYFVGILQKVFEV